MFYQFQHFGVSEAFSKECGTDFSFPLHLHQSFELIAVESGEMEVTVNDGEYRLTAGEAVLIFPNCVHSLSSRTCRHLLCIFSPELVRAFSSKYSAALPVNCKFRLGEYLMETLRTIHDGASYFEKKGFLYSVCAAFDKGAEYRERSDGEDDLLYKIFEFVESNYRNACSLELLAEKIAYSYSYLSRYFKRTTGISFNEYINRYRISKACHLLNNSGCSVVQCAYDVGYNSLRSFNRNFKEYTGMTPVEYRK